MTSRKTLLRANALYLLVAAADGMCNDLAGAFLGYGPVGKVLSAAPDAAIGFVEAQARDLQSHVLAALHRFSSPFSSPLQPLPTRSPRLAERKSMRSQREIKARSKRDDP